PRFCDSFDIAVLILIGMLMRKLDTQRRLLQNVRPLCLATSVGLERSLDVPSVDRSFQIVERARMTPHCTEDRRNQEIPSHEHKRGEVTATHSASRWVTKPGRR